MLADQQVEQALRERAVRRPEQRVRKSRGRVDPPGGPLRPGEDGNLPAPETSGGSGRLPRGAERMHGPGLPEPGYGPVRGTLVAARRKTPPLWIARRERHGCPAFTRRHHDKTSPNAPFVAHSADDHRVRSIPRRLNEGRKRTDTIVRFSRRSGGTPHTDGFAPSAGRTDPPREDRRGSHTGFIYPNLTPPPGTPQLIMVRVDPIAPDRSRLFPPLWAQRRHAGPRTRHPAADRRGGHRHHDPADGEPPLTALPRGATECLGREAHHMMRLIRRATPPAPTSPTARPARIDRCEPSAGNRRES